PSSPPPKLRAVAYGLTDRGMQREHNEDSFSVLNEYGLFVVADGMGGHLAGDVASRIATDTIAEFFRSTANEDVTWPFHFDTNLTEEENRLLTGIRVANRQILDRSEKSRECYGMGTTVVGAMFSPSKNKVFIGHVGDSRCYRIRQGQIKLLTRDHSLVNDYITAIPNLTEEQKADLPKNVITRALGMQKDVVVDLQSDDPQPDDIYVLCSDGLNGMLRDEEILEIVTTHGLDLSARARKLIDVANANGGEDNITVVLIHIEALPPLAETIPAPRVSAPTFSEEDTLPGELLALTPANSHPHLSEPPLASTPPTPPSTNPPPSEVYEATIPSLAGGPFQDEDTLLTGQVPPSKNGLLR
ncbi:MAG: Stp1/IreP family PP2C-type Ser/Thr phosphatase, partial [Myxococcales bacterium]|nr:Stp1/IreP family PP2C-type Ser/Thr phosphatase [Myxococcales bacterium]